MMPPIEPQSRSVMLCISHPDVPMRPYILLLHATSIAIDALARQITHNELGSHSSIRSR